MQDRADNLNDPLDVLIVPGRREAPARLAVTPQPEATVAGAVEHKQAVIRHHPAPTRSIVERGPRWDVGVSQISDYPAQGARPPALMGAGG